MTRKLIALLAATIAALTLTAGSASAWQFPPQQQPQATIVYSGPTGLSTYQTSADRVSGAHSVTGAPATMYVNYGPCALTPSGTPNVYLLRATGRGTCVLGLHVDAQGGYPALDSNQTIGVAR